MNKINKYKTESWMANHTATTNFHSFGRILEIMDTTATLFLHTNRNHDYEDDTRLLGDQVTVQFRPNDGRELPGSDDSDYCSPPMWKSSPSSPRSAAEPLLGGHGQEYGHRSLSPNSRTQAIARGQMELMEMVKGLPESSYELSLKDIVEHHRMENQGDKEERLSNDLRDHQNLRQMGVVRVKRQESMRVEKSGIRRNGRFENRGMFLKVFPVFDLSSKRKKVAGNNNSSGRVSPKPEAVKGGGERDWWKKKFTGSSDSDSSRISNNSGTGSSGGRSYGGGSGRNKQGFLGGCWPFYQSRRRKSSVAK